MFHVLFCRTSLWVFDEETSEIWGVDEQCPGHGDEPNTNEASDEEDSATVLTDLHIVKV